jgi:hypothetical protein
LRKIVGRELLPDQILHIKIVNRKLRSNREQTLAAKEQLLNPNNSLFEHVLTCFYSFWIIHKKYLLKISLKNDFYETLFKIDSHFKHFLNFFYYPQKRHRPS